MMWHDIWRDLLYGFRTLSKAPAFALIAILSLALGIGANSAIFSVVNTVLLQPLPFPEPDRLVMIFEGIPQFDVKKLPFSPPDFVNYQKESRSFDGLAAFTNRPYELSGGERPERLMGARASAGLFETLGVKPAIGRAFNVEEDRAGRPVAILSHELWQRRFDSDPAIVGRPITLDRRPYSVIGVMPRGFEWPLRGPAYNDEPALLYVPLSFTPEELRGFGNRYNHTVIGRLRRGVTPTQAQAEASAMAKRLATEIYPPDFGVSALTAAVAPLRGEVAGPIQKLLLILLGAVGLVLLIGCADVASLQMTRAAARSREMAIRTALGASRARLLRQTIAESLTLALAGGALGLVFADWGTSLLVRFAPIEIPRLQDVRVDIQVVCFTVAVSLLTALVFGFAPAVILSRANLNQGLREGGRNATPGRRRQRLLSVLVAAQFAVACVLLAGAGLLMRSFAHLLATDPGFRPDHVLTLRTSLPAVTYKSALQVRSFYQRLENEIGAAPGAIMAGLSTGLPLSVHDRRAFSVDGEPPDAAAGAHTVIVVWTLGRYFEALGIPLKAGRYFTPRDGQTGEHVAIVNEALARRFFPSVDLRDVIGRKIRWGKNRNSTWPWMTIAGIVADVKHGPLSSRVEPEAYEPYLQVSNEIIEDTVGNGLRALTLAVRTSGDPASIATTLREDIRRLDPSLPVTDVQTLEAFVQRSTNPQRFSTFLLGAFAAAALLLAAFGVYGVLAYSIAQRTNELGVRVALGATRAGIVVLVVRQGLMLAGVGLAIGLAASFAITRWMGSLLYGVGPRDPLTFLLAPAVLGSVALLAAYLPARKASRVDPMTALRNE